MYTVGAVADLSLMWWWGDVEGQPGERALPPAAMAAVAGSGLSRLSQRWEPGTKCRSPKWVPGMYCYSQHGLPPSVCTMGNVFLFPYFYLNERHRASHPFFLGSLSLQDAHGHITYTSSRNRGGHGEGLRLLSEASWEVSQLRHLTGPYYILLTTRTFELSNTHISCLESMPN